MALDHAGQPAIEPRRRHMRVPVALDGEDRVHQPVDILAGEPGQRHHRHAAQLRQQPVAGLAQARQRRVLVLDQVPFIDRDHQGAPFALHKIRQRQILLFERDGGVEHQHDHFGILDRAQAVAHRQLFQLLGDARPAADAGSVDQVDHPAFPLPRHEDGIAGYARFRPDQHAFLAHHAVDQRRLARIGTADNGDVEIPLGVPAQRRLVPFALQHVLGDVDIDLGQGVEIGDFARFLLLRRPVDRRRNDGIELRQPQPMLGRERNGLPEAELIGFHQPGFCRAALGLVADQMHVLARLAQHLCEALVQRRHPGAGVDHEEDDVGFPDGQLGLLAHAVLEAAIGHVLVAGGVENAEGEVRDAALGLAPVAGHAGRVVHQRDLAADQAIEQRGLADIGATDNGNGDGHALVFRSGRRAGGRYCATGSASVVSAGISSPAVSSTMTEVSATAPSASNWAR